jgi:cephalosporin hydroxylase
MPQPSTARTIGLIIVIVVLAGFIIIERFGYLPRSPVSPASRPQSKQEIIDNFHKLFYESAVWNTTRWLGVISQQNPNDAWIHQEIIVDVKPDFIVEAGTLHGGSAALWATILQQVNPNGRIITIDIEDKAADAKKLPIVRQHVDFLIGSSTDPAIVAEVKKRVEGRKVLVILDSDHRKGHVLAEMKAYAPLVSVGSYLIVQDTNVNGHPVWADFGPGPMEAVQEFLASNQQFKPDEKAERLMFTLHPKGYLKRIY